jgi:hypothetical protein
LELAEALSRVTAKILSIRPNSSTTTATLSAMFSPE